MIAGLLIAAIIRYPAASVAAVIDPRPDPDAYSLLSSMDLEPLLLSGKGGVIDSANGAPAPGLATCEWLGRPQDHAVDAVPRGVSLAFYHLARHGADIAVIDASRADLAELDQQASLGREASRATSAERAAGCQR